MTIKDIENEVIKQLGKYLELNDFAYYKSYQSFHRKRRWGYDLIHFRFLNCLDSIEVEIEIGIRYNDIFEFKVQEFPTFFKKVKGGVSIAHRIEIIKSQYEQHDSLAINNTQPWIISDVNEINIYVNDWIDLLKLYAFRFFDDFSEIEALYDAYNNTNNPFYEMVDTPFKKFDFPIVSIMLKKDSLDDYVQSTYKKLLDEHAKLGDLYYVLKQYNSFIELLVKKGYLKDDLIYHKIHFD